MTTPPKPLEELTGETADELVRATLGIPPADPRHIERFGPPTYTAEQVVKFARRLSLSSGTGAGEPIGWLLRPLRPDGAPQAIYASRYFAEQADAGDVGRTERAAPFPVYAAPPLAVQPRQGELAQYDDAELFELAARGFGDRMSPEGVDVCRQEVLRRMAAPPPVSTPGGMVMVPAKSLPEIVEAMRLCTIRNSRPADPERPFESPWECAVALFQTALPPQPKG